MIRLPLDTKSLYFNIKNDNATGHTATVATPLKKVRQNDRLNDIYLIDSNKIDLNNKIELVEMLIKHSKTKVKITDLFVFNNLSVNGKYLDTNCSFGCYIKEEIDDTKIQYGRLKLHYPSKLIYSDDELNINNKIVYKAISEKLNHCAFIIKTLEFDEVNRVLNFDALIVGENNIPYSKVFINEKGAGNKFNKIFNENADDYDREILYLRKKFGDIVNPSNYLDYFQIMKCEAIKVIERKINKKLDLISFDYPYSLFDFCYYEKNIKKYGILRVTSTNNVYFNLSLMQQSFMFNNIDDVNVFLVSNVLDDPQLHIINYDRILGMSRTINSIKYEED